MICHHIDIFVMYLHHPLLWKAWVVLHFFVAIFHLEQSFVNILNYLFRIKPYSNTVLRNTLEVTDVCQMLLVFTELVFLSRVMASLHSMSSYPSHSKSICGFVNICMGVQIHEVQKGFPWNVSLLYFSSPWLISFTTGSLYLLHPENYSLGNRVNTFVITWCGDKCHYASLLLVVSPASNI